MPAQKMPLDEVRAAMDRWAETTWWQARGLGGGSEVGPVTAHGAYRFRLRTQYEDRSVEPATAPYRGEKLPEQGRPPDPWDVFVQAPLDFSEQAISMPLPNTERVEGCGPCRERGRVRCPTCNGSGKATCEACGGSALQTITLMRPQPIFTGRFMSTIMVPYTSTVPCECGSGEVPCKNCLASGEVECQKCRGRGRVRAFERLTVVFRAPERVESRLPDGTTLDDLAGEEWAPVIDERAERLLGCPPLPDDVAPHAEAMLRESQSAPAERTRVLFQRLVVERVPVVEVKYRYRGGAERRLWLVGEGGRVVARDAPLAWGRIVMAAALALAAYGGLMAGAVWGCGMPLPTFLSMSCLAAFGITFLGSWWLSGQEEAGKEAKPRGQLPQGGQEEGTGSTNVRRSSR